MARVKRGVEARRRHKKILKQAKGYYGARSRVYRVAVQAATLKQVNMLIVTVALKSVPSVDYGLHVLTLNPVQKACHTAV